MLGTALAHGTTHSVVAEKREWPSLAFLLIGKDKRAVPDKYIHLRFEENNWFTKFS